MARLGQLSKANTIQTDFSGLNGFMNERLYQRDDGSEEEDEEEGEGQAAADEHLLVPHHPTARSYKEHFLFL